MKTLLNRIKRDKYEITSWNKNLIQMNVFKSFITVELTLIQEHLGASTGWTKYENTEHKLIIKGGFYGGVEYLHYLNYGEKLDNPWNNFVNPFYLKEIMTNDGIVYFLSYYDEEIKEILKADKDSILIASKRLKEAKEYRKKIEKTLNEFQLVTQSP